MPAGPSTLEKLIADGARTVHSSFGAFLVRFNHITRKARAHFENARWQQMQQDAVARLNIYPAVIDELITRLERLLGEHASSQAYWGQVRPVYAGMMAGDRNAELARTFFNSVTRRICSTVGVNPKIEFVSLEVEEPYTGSAAAVYHRFEPAGSTQDLVRTILETYRFSVPYLDLERDCTQVAQVIEAQLQQKLGTCVIDGVETIRPVFFRNKGAYIVGRIRCGGQLVPLVLPLRNREGKVAVDAVLTNESEVSIVFSFTRSYFHVETECPRQLILALKSILPLKPVAELYISLGFNKHGKTVLYRNLQRHLRGAQEKFQTARGSRGMVMMVFTLPSYDVVFKVIRDRFHYPKNSTRQQVMDQYRLVFTRDRVGRLVDAQEFRYLDLRKGQFSPELLQELVEQAGRTVQVEGSDVIIKHLYTERKVTPLNLFLREADGDAAEQAVIDYGHAIKDLAAADIFPGDFLLKNFGVTRHGRVVFYDYDELRLLSQCHFRTVPAARNPEEELEADPWFRVAENDVFPEEFLTFLGLQDPLRDIFLRYHGDLFTVDFWRRLQVLEQRGEVMEFFPYPQSNRLKNKELD